MSQALDIIARDFRSAVLAGEHALAGRLACEYSDAVRQVWDAIPEADRAASTLPVTACELLAWARGVTIVQHAMARAQLRVAQKAIRYKSSQIPASYSHAIQFQG